MSDIVTGHGAGAAIVAAGLAPPNCSELNIRFEPRGAVIVETKSLLWDEAWVKFLEIVKAAKAAGAVVEIHTVKDPRTGDYVVSSVKPE